MGGLAATAILSLCLAGQVGQPPVAQPPAVSPVDDGLPQLLATRQMLFFIPFGIDAHDKIQQAFWQLGPEHEGAEARGAESRKNNLSVQLWVSRDRGQSWRFAEAVPSSRRGFLFRAKHDGEYWFIVRTLYPSGTARDDRPSAPELRVLVDTQAPTLRLDAWRGEGGQVCSRWVIDETYLKPGSLEILYRTGPRQQWRPVAIDRRADRGRADYGPWMVNWCPSAGAKFVQIRAKVVDMAGNTSISHAHVDMVGAHVDTVDRPREVLGNLGYPNTAIGPIATRPGGLSGWPTGGPNRRPTR